MLSNWVGVAWRRKLVLPVLLLGALVIAGVAFSASGPNEQLVSQNRVYGGGSFTPFDTTHPQRNFAVDAHANGPTAFGDVEYGTASTYRHEQVLCLNVSGNKAAIGAVITQSNDPQIVGWLALWVVADNGTPNSGNADQATFQLLGPATDPTWPTGFPSTCPSPDAAIATFQLDSFSLNGGDVAVQPAARR